MGIQVIRKYTCDHCNNEMSRCNALIVEDSGLVFHEACMLEVDAHKLLKILDIPINTIRI